jgi:hypothetical protein
LDSDKPSLTFAFKEVNPLIVAQLPKVASTKHRVFKLFRKFALYGNGKGGNVPAAS